MNTSNENYFVTLSKVNVSQHIERKGDFAYLSWPFAVGGMLLGARIGIAVLVDGSPRDIVQRRWANLMGRKNPD